jgi:hypothetical protein
MADHGGRHLPRRLRKPATMAGANNLHGALNDSTLRPGSVLLTVPLLATISPEHRRHNLQLRLLHNMVSSERGMFMGLIPCVPDVRDQAHLCVRGLGGGEGGGCFEDALS